MSCSIITLIFFVTALTIINAFQNRDVRGIRKRNSVQKRSSSSSSSSNARINIDNCADRPCGDYGHCTNRVNGYRCQCSPGFTGTDCEKDVDDCVNQPCGDNGQCIDIINGFYCKCDSGFTGELCDGDINDCDPNPCENGGICQDGRDNFSCLCDGTGFTGKLCECNIDACASNPCGENGRCTDEVSGFNCVCDDGFGGNNCEIDMNKCASKPCGDNGNCVYDVSGFICECDDGFTGDHCETACDRPLDIVIAVDSTDDPENHLTLRNAIANAVRDFFVDTGSRRVGVVSFGSVKGDVLSITDDVDQLQQSIRVLEYPGLGTNTRLGIEEAQTLLETEGRPDVADIMIVIVEGKTDTGGDPILAAMEAKSKGTDIYVIGIGDVDIDELRVIASADSQIKITSSFSQPEPFLEEFALQIC